MKWVNRLAYGAGQMQKDLAASVLSIFSILYFENCLGIQSVEVGTLWLYGQVVNAVSTPLIGYFSDRATNQSENLDTVKQSFGEEQSKLTRILMALKLRFSLSNRKAWHLYGSLLLTISLPALFGQPEQFAYYPLWAKLLVCGSLLTFVQIGWAAVQIAHLTMVNSLSTDQAERVLLVSLRYFFASVGDISTFLLSYILLQEKSPQETTTLHLIEEQSRNISTSSPFISSSNSSRALTGSQFTIKDMPFFRNITLVLTAYGVLFVICFQLCVPERLPNVLEKRDQRGSENEVDRSLAASAPCILKKDPVESMPEFIKSLDEFQSLASQLNELGRSRSQIYNKCFCQTVNHAVESKLSNPRTLRWYDWFRMWRFWVGCIIFTTTRTSVTLSNVYLSPFLLKTLKLEKSSIVLMPLVIYGTSLVTALIQHRITKLTGRLGNTLIGVIFSLSYSTVIFFYQPENANQVMVYIAAILLGIGSAFNNVVAIVVVSDMIGTSQVQTAAFVHGFASLMDKIFTGLSIQMIQLTIPWLSYRDVEVFIAGSFLLIGGSLSVFDYTYWTLNPLRKMEEQKQTTIPQTMNHDSWKSKENVKV
ncbi:hypothetical protein EG68_08984 [Paragonimus skrjabini miyazakii]|uniref:Uncharacterized protein n=1 Tax=Paragonimus skrjabini miyazakii TaxID=59628 RepID=A0A8S9YP09_9TREM|nr:hypothetical protein EG68_08984 [Paragonimus skrjabini miyazakii]